MKRVMPTLQQDRETEPRFQATAPNPRGGYDGGFGGRGGYQGGPGMGGGMMGGAGRQIFVSNVCIHFPTDVDSLTTLHSCPTTLAGRISKTCSVKPVSKTRPVKCNSY